METRTDVLNTEQISIGLDDGADLRRRAAGAAALDGAAERGGRRTWLTRNIRVNVPLLSAAMDTVTESRLAIAMAQQGGIGIIHKNLSVEEQASEVDRVKRSESGMIVNPITLSPTNRIYEALDLMKKYRISGVPITEDGSKEGKLVGILTNRDLRFESNLDRPISDIMTRDPLFTVPVGTTLEQAREFLHRHKVEKLLVVDDQFMLKGLITVKDIQKMIKYPNACKDALGRLRVGAAIGVGKDALERAEALVARHVDVLVIDTAHGHSQGVLDMVEARPPRVSRTSTWSPATSPPREATEALIDLGVDAVKVGIGAGSICTTRVVAGIGVPMITAVAECARAAAPHKRADHRRRRHPLLRRHHQGDGGRRELRDDRQPVRRHRREPGRDDSLSRAAASRNTAAWDRSARCAAAAATATSRTSSTSTRRPEPAEKLVPEGIEGRVAHKGSVAAMIHQLVGGLRAGMGYCGAGDIPDAAARGQADSRHPGRPPRRPRPRRDHHEGSAELPS